MKNNSFACRLCLNYYEENPEECVTIANSTVVLEFLGKISEIDLTLTAKPIFCKNCSGKIIVFNAFKEKCLINENYFKSYGLSKDVKPNTDINLQDVLQHFGNEYDEESTDICRVCLQYTNKNTDSSLNGNYKCENILSRLIPDFNVISIKQSLLCTDCCKCVEEMDVFIEMCLKNQTSLQKYTRKEFPVLLPGDVLLIAKEERKKIEHEKYIKRFLEELPGLVPEEEKKLVLPKHLKCRYCNHRAKSKGFLNRHIKITHNKEQNDLKEKLVALDYYHCDKCSFKTVKKSCLTKHINLVHYSRVKVHLCKHCGFQTNSLRSLNVHIKNDHANFIKYKCKLCEYEASLRLNLKDHVKKVHKNEGFEVFKCSHCDFETRRESSFEKHMRLNHKNVQESLKKNTEDENYASSDSDVNISELRMKIKQNLEMV